MPDHVSWRSNLNQSGTNRWRFCTVSYGFKGFQERQIRDLVADWKVYWSQNYSPVGNDGKIALLVWQASGIQIALK